MGIFNVMKSLFRPRRPQSFSLGKRRAPGIPGGREDVVSVSRSLEFENFAWLTKYSNAAIGTRVNVDIRRYGLTLGPLYVPPSEYIRKGQ